MAMWKGGHTAAAAMEVEVASSTVLPAPLTDHHDLPLTVFDKLVSDMHVAVLYAFSPPAPTTPAVVYGLCKTLTSFPTLAGELSKSPQGTPVLRLRNGGVLVIEARVGSTLQCYLSLQPSRELLLLHPSTEEPAGLLQVQVNRFRCGGLVIGVTAHHRVADGRSMSNFFVAWGRAVRGLDVEPVAIYDRGWMNPRSPPRVEFRHWGVDFRRRPTADRVTHDSSDIPTPPPPEMASLCNLRLCYTSAYISTELKPKTGGGKHTTFETLLAHLWRKITVARGLHQEEHTCVRVAVDGRRRLRPPAPPEFFGNVVANAHARAKVKDLMAGGAAGAARLIHDAVGRVGDGYLRSLIDFGEVTRDVEDVVPASDDEGSVLCPNLEVDSWLGFGFDEVDFGGGGRLCGFSPTWIPVEGVVVLAPTAGAGERGGVEVTVTLFEEHAKQLRQLSHDVED